MRKFTFSFKSLLVAFLLLGGTNSAWADDLPTPVYSQNFESASTTVGEAGSNFGITGATLTGTTGAIIEGDAVFGKYYQNMSTAGAITTRENYLTIVDATTWDNIRTAAGTSHAFTISFWANAKVQRSKGFDSYWGSMFTGYTSAGGTPTGGIWDVETLKAHPFGPAVCTAGQFRYYNSADGTNYGDITDNADAYRDAVVAWRDDDNWHHFAYVFTDLDKKAFKITCYVDGVKKYEISETSYATGMEMLNGIDRFVIGGSTPHWSDPDNAYAYDEIALYGTALKAGQVAAITAAKKYNFTEVVGKYDKSSPSGTKSSDYKIKKGETKVFTFRNYGLGENGSGNVYYYHNWTIVAKASADKISTRADFYDNTKSGHTDGIWNVMSTDGGVSKTALNWDNFVADLSSATVVATLSYAVDGKLSLNVQSTGDANGYIYYVDHSVTGVTEDELTVNLYVEHSWLGIISVEQTAVPVNIGAYRYASFSSENALDFTDVDGLTAFIVTGTEDSKIAMQSVTGSVAANTGLVLKGNPGTYSIPVVATGTTYDSESDPKNYMFAVTSDYNLGTPKTGTNYVLTVQDEKVVFAPIGGTKAAVKKGQAALWLPSGIALVKVLNIVDDTATGVEAPEVIEAEEEEEVLYNTAGVRVGKDYKGIVINQKGEKRLQK